MKKLNVRALCATAILGALSTVLMMLSFSIPVMPSFIKMDFSELPALIASFAFGPVWGVGVCLIKNLINVLFSTTGGIGELSNFILGAAFTAVAGIIYKHVRTRRGALIAATSGSAAMAVFSVLSNYFIIYPLYARFMMPEEVILGMYRVIAPDVNNLFDALLIFNLPFTFVKGMADAAVCFLIYKSVSPLLKGKTK